MRQKLFLLIHLLNLLVIFWSLMIYLSVYEWHPWYEGSGLQLVGVFITSVPAFLILGVALMVVGRSMRISLFNRLIPFVAMAIFVLPLFVTGDATSVFIGTIVGIAFVPFVLFSTISVYVSMNKNEVRIQTNAHE